MVTGIVLGIFVLAGILFFGFFMRDKKIKKMLLAEGVTVDLPIVDLRENVSTSNNNGRFSTDYTYTLYYEIDGKTIGTSISAYDYQRLEIGQLVPITHANGHSRFNLDKKDFPVKFAEGYTPGMSRNKVVNDYDDFDDHNYRQNNRGLRNRNPNGMNGGSGLNVSIGGFNISSGNAHNVPSNFRSNQSRSKGNRDNFG